MTRTPARTTRWGLGAIGLGTLACIGCCALPLLAAGGILSGSLAVAHDWCLAPLAILLVVVGLAALRVWIRQRRTTDRFGAGVDCGCSAVDAESDALASNTIQPTAVPEGSEVHSRLLGSAP